MPKGSGGKWVECSLIIRTGCRVQVLAWTSISQSVCQRAFSLLEIRFQRPSGSESCIQQRKTTCILSIRKSIACARAASKLTTRNMYVCMLAMHTYIHACVCSGYRQSWYYFVLNYVTFIGNFDICMKYFTMHLVRKDLMNDCNLCYCYRCLHYICINHVELGIHGYCETHFVKCRQPITNHWSPT